MKNTLAITFLLIGMLLVQQFGQNGTVVAQTVSEEANQVHMSGMLFDGHNDLPWAMRMRADSSFDKVDIAEPTEFHTDIDRLRKGGVKAQFWSVYVPASYEVYGNALITTLEQIELVHEMCKRYPDVFEMASTAADIERITAEGKIASMIGVEGGHSIQNSLQALRELYDRGARYMTLTHSKTLAWADSATDDAKNNGLSPFGKEVVREMNRIGMLVDLSHVSEKCMRDALEIAKAPVIYSHSSAREICDHPRNVSDELLKLTAQNGGVVMVNFMSGYIVPTDILKENERERGNLGMVCDHIEHIIKVAGIDHVGIGGDYDGVRRLPVGLEDVSTYPKITQELINRGYDKEQIHKLLGGNVLRVLKQTEKVAANLKKQRADRVNTKPLFKVKVEAGELDRENEVVQVMLDLNGFQGSVVSLTDRDQNTVFGQVSVPALHSEGEGKRLLTFVVPKLKAGATVVYEARETGLNAHREFSWHDDSVGEAALLYGDDNVMTYMYEPLDDSSKQRTMETYKVYHHVYDVYGNERLTKGPGGLFPHHRGLFYGFNRISYDGKSADVWHCKDGAHQSHEKSVVQIAGPVFGRHLAVVNWRGKDGQPFAQELREMTAYRFGESTLIEFNSRLESAGSDIVLDGDPQHAGFQFRATQRVPDETKAKTFYIRPDGKGEPGKFRNWSGKGNESDINKRHVNLPWNALNMTVGEKQYTVCYLDLDSNPKESRFSERDYGRFGSYFRYELTPEKPLDLNYRILIREGEMSVEEIEQMSQSFRQPAKATVFDQVQFPSAKTSE